MNVAEQEALFKQVAAKFGGFTRWHSGYVAGVVEADRFQPDPCRAAAKAISLYMQGYLAGYLDAAGADAMALFPGLSIAPRAINFRWWEK